MTFLKEDVQEIVAGAGATPVTRIALSISDLSLLPW